MTYWIERGPSSALDGSETLFYFVLSSSAVAKITLHFTTSEDLSSCYCESTNYNTKKKLSVDEIVSWNLSEK